MATIPGIFIIGGANVHGGDINDTPSTQVTAADPLLLTDAFDRNLLRVIPDDPADASSDADDLSWWPWFDTNFGTTYVVTAATATTVTVELEGGGSPNFTTDEWDGFTLTNSNPTPGYGFENLKISITGNTADTLTISGSWTTTPTVGTGLWMNEGAFTDYAALGGYRTLVEVLASQISKRGGSSIFQNNSGIGYDGGLLRMLWKQVFTIAPYFVVAKYASGNDIADLASAGAQRTSAEEYMTRVNAGFASRYPSDTVDWRYCIIDYTDAEVQSWIDELPGVTQLLAYTTNLAAVNTWLRSSTMMNNASGRIIIPNHDTILRNVDGPAAVAQMNSYNDTVAAADDNMRVCRFDGLNLGTNGTSLTLNNADNDDQEWYVHHHYRNECAQALTDTIKLWEAGAPAEAVKSGMPVYLIIGDSIDVATYMDSAYTGSLESDVYSATTRDSRQRVYNRGNVAIEAYDAHNNSQTSASTNQTGLAGLEFALTVELMNRHPDTGFVIIKRASSSSALATESASYDANENGGRWIKGIVGEHYEELTTDVQNAYQAIFQQFGRQADLRGIFVGLGTNDASVADSGAAFSSALKTFCTNLRNDFGTRTSGKAVPILWRKPQLGLPGRIEDELVAIRAALADYALTDEQFIVVNHDDYETGSDNLHLGPQATFNRAARSAAALDLVALPNCG